MCPGWWSDARLNRILHAARRHHDEPVLLRDEMSWFENRPLFGRRIILADRGSQAAAIGERIRELGAEVLEVPEESLARLDLAPLREEFTRLLSKVEHGVGESRDVDLLIRTGGEQRLSDFLLWECAYAELYFTRRMWPEFSPKDLAEAVEEFRSRERRFGTVPAAAAG